MRVRRDPLDHKGRGPVQHLVPEVAICVILNLLSKRCPRRQDSLPMTGSGLIARRDALDPLQGRDADPHWSSVSGVVRVVEERRSFHFAWPHQQLGPGKPDLSWTALGSTRTRSAPMTAWRTTRRSSIRLASTCGARYTPTAWNRSGACSCVPTSGPSTSSARSIYSGT